MIDRGAVLSARNVVRVFGLVPEKAEAATALIQWADEARKLIALMLMAHPCLTCGRINEHSAICPTAALLAEWPKEER